MAYKSVSLSAEHIAAVRRRRRIIVYSDVITADGPRFATKAIDRLVAWKFAFADQPGSQIDSMFFNWGEGHQAPHPNDWMPLFDDEGFRRWAAEGIDCARVFHEAARRRGIESFYSYRVNGSDNDLGPFDEVPFKKEHPEWLIESPWGPKYLDFTVEEVRRYKLAILRDVAERYDFDGIDLDFARVPIWAKGGRQWQHRDHMTQFVRDVRAMTLEVERRRGRPFLLSARVSENIGGCHYDGFDVETWVRERLIDLFVLGDRTFDVDVSAFRLLTAGTDIRLYPCFDDHHSSDGYQYAPIEVFRGLASNWFEQGADGITMFNCSHATEADTKRLVGDMWLEPNWATHQIVARELGVPATLRGKDKVFVVERRGGGCGPAVVPNPEDWHTPRHFYFWTNQFAQLPAPLRRDGRTDTLLRLHVGDDLGREADALKSVELRLLLSDRAAKDLPEDQKIASAVIRKDFTWLLHTHPLRKGIENRLEVRINNCLLPPPTVRDGWVVYRDVDPRFLARGGNLLGVCLSETTGGSNEPVLIEKVELEVRYRAEGQGEES